MRCPSGQRFSTPSYNNQSLLTPFQSVRGHRTHDIVLPWLGKGEDSGIFVGIFVGDII